MSSRKRPLTTSPGDIPMDSSSSTSNKKRKVSKRNKKKSAKKVVINAKITVTDETIKDLKNRFFGESLTEDPDLSSWDVSEVTDMKYLFKLESNFTGKGLEKWDVSNVTNMNGMFARCKNFTGSVLKNWATQLHKLEYIENMFYNCTTLDAENVQNWDVKNVISMDGTFQNTNLTHLSWITENVKDMSAMFSGCLYLTNVSFTNVSNVSDFNYMFSGCEHFIGEGLNSWNVSSVKSMYGMFINCSELNVDLSRWSMPDLVDSSLSFPANFNAAFLPQQILQEREREEREERERILAERAQHAHEFRRATEIHKAAESMNYDKFKSLVSQTPNFNLPQITIHNIYTYIATFFNKNITKLFTSKRKVLINGRVTSEGTVLQSKFVKILEQITQDSYNLNFFWEKTKFALRYVELQSPTFIKTYIKEFITSVFTAYPITPGNDGRSCTKGMWERFLFAIKLAIEEIKLINGSEKDLPQNWEEMLQTFEQVTPVDVLKE